jgi:hypothetical protein
VTVNVTRDQVRNAPEWASGQPVDSTFEDQLYAYYTRQHPLDREQSRGDRLIPSKFAPGQEKSMNTLEQTMPMETSAVVAIYDTHPEAETAIRDLQKMGFDMTKLSIVGKDYHTDEDVIKA